MILYKSSWAAGGRGFGLLTVYIKRLLR